MQYPRTGHAFSGEREPDDFGDEASACDPRRVKDSLVTCINNPEDVIEQVVAQLNLVLANAVSV